MGAVGARRIALALAAFVAVGVLGLILLSVLGDPFGTLNDLGNAAIGVLSAVLAFSVLPGRGSDRPGGHGAGLGASVLGGGVMIIGSLLVVLEVSGWYYAALVSSLGAAGIGLWLVVVNDRFAGFGCLSVGALRLGRFAGIVMLAGVLAVPSLLNRVDVWEIPPWYLSCSQVSWLGTYVLYPIWCVLLARSLGPTEP
jgi:hypothetical protein